MKNISHEIKICSIVQPGIEPGTSRVLGERDNHYTTEPLMTAQSAIFSESIGILYVSLCSQFTQAEEDAIAKPILEKYDEEGHPYYASAR